MNLRLVQFSLGSDSRSKAESIAGEIVPAIREQPGCERCEFFADFDAGDYGIVVLWASADDADAAAQVIAPKLGPILQGANATGDSRRLFDVVMVS